MTKIFMILSNIQDLKPCVTGLMTWGQLKQWKILPFVCRHFDLPFNESELLRLDVDADPREDVGRSHANGGAEKLLSLVLVIVSKSLLG